MKDYNLANYSTSLAAFNSPEFGQVRAVEIDGAPFFVGVDVARALSYAKPSQAVIDHCKGIRKLGIPSGRGEQETNIIPEGDVYRLIIKAADQSKSETVRDKAEHFERWIFDEVIPAIRKTGGYIAATPDMTPEQIMAQALKIADATLAERDRQIADLKPKALFADSVANSDSLILVRDLAKILNQSGYRTGGNRLYEQLRKDGYLVAGNSSDRNMPTQRAAELGLFRVVESTITTPDGEAIISRTAKVTGKGQQYFVKRYCGGGAL